MKMLKFWVLFLDVANLAFMLLIVSCSSIHDETSIITEDSVMAVTSIRRLKEGSNIRRKINEDNVNLEDYHKIDPVPSSSAAAITSGPIEHSTPLMPYIPKLAPPDSPQHDISPTSSPPPLPA